MKSKATVKTVEKLMKKAKLNMKRAKARADQPMFLHHQSRYQALAG
jgi:hypothetical protein